LIYRNIFFITHHLAAIILPIAK